MELHDAIHGCLLGGAIGDGLGSAYEGTRAPVEIDDHVEWRLTDDTQLTLATCEAIAMARGVDPDRIAKRMAAWFREGRVSGLGASTLKARSELAQGAHWALAGRRGEMAAGNGAAARIAPLAFWLDPEVSSDRQIIRDISRITHHSDEAYAAALAVVISVRVAQSGGWRGGSGLTRLVLAALPDTRVRDRLIELEALGVNRSIADVAAGFGCSGYAVESVPLAIYAAQCADELGFKGMLRALVAAGGDTDTTASIAGQIVGALLGQHTLPVEMVARLPGSAAIRQIAQQFAGATTGRTA